MHTTGSSANHNELLNDLRLWLTGTVGWTELLWDGINYEAVAVEIVDGGTGYIVTDLLTVSGGTCEEQTTLTVTSVSGGVIDGVEITESGIYSVAPSNPVSVTGGTGTGATFNMTYEGIPTETPRLSLEGPGGGEDSRVYLNIQTDNSVGDGFYSWILYGATGADPGAPFGTWPGGGGGAYFNLWQHQIDWWAYANDRRVIVEAKCSTNYMSMYAGFFLPFALPSEYPFPYAIIASYPEMQTPSHVNARNSMVPDPGGDGAAWYRRRTTETWTMLKNQRHSTTYLIAPETGRRAFVWPYKTGRTTSTGSGTGVNNWGPDGFYCLRPNANDESPLIQCHIIDLDDLTCVGALEGVYATTGFGRTTEQQLTVGERTFRLFQRAFRNEAGDYWAVEEV